MKREEFSFNYDRLHFICLSLFFQWYVYLPILSFKLFQQEQTSNSFCNAMQLLSKLCREFNLKEVSQLSGVEK